VYYRPTKDAEVLVDRTFSPSGGGKATRALTHRIGVRLTATYYEQQGYDAQMYHSQTATPTSTTCSSPRIMTLRTNATRSSR